VYFSQKAITIFQLMGKNIFARIAANMNATARITTSSGRTLMPFVSSSKNRSNPALAAGMGELLSLFFFLRLNPINP